MNFTKTYNLENILNFLRIKKKTFLTDIDQTKVFLNNCNKLPVIGHNIRVIGMRRSGNHAIINWLLGQFSEKTIFLNNLNPKLKQLRRGKDNVYFPKLQTIFDQDSFKDAIVHSYEDTELSLFDNPYYNLMRLIYFGKAQKKIDILILRDPYNMIASRLKATKIKRDYRVAPRDQWSTFMEDNQAKYMNFYYQDFLAVQNPNITPIELWVQYAREFMGETNFLKTKICINFNRWFLDTLYRQEITKKLGIAFTDSNLNQVLNYGQGSSFDGKLYNSNAQNMKVLERWQYFTDDEDYLSLINNPEIEYLSRKLFDFIPF